MWLFSEKQLYIFFLSPMIFGVIEIHCPLSASLQWCNISFFLLQMIFWVTGWAFSNGIGDWDKQPSPFWERQLDIFKWYFVELRLTSHFLWSFFFLSFLVFLSSFVTFAVVGTWWKPRQGWNTGERKVWKGLKQVLHESLGLGVVLEALNDNTKILSDTNTETFFPIANFPKPRLFSKTKFFRNRNRDFFPKPNFPKPKPSKIGKRFETEMSISDPEWLH